MFNRLFDKKGGSSSTNGKDLEHLALLQVTSALKSQKDISTFFEVIGRESVHAVKANRATVFLLDGPKGVLKNQFSYSPQPDEKMSFLEEKEIARRAIIEKKPMWLKDPSDFSEFFKYEGRERKITSLISVPFGFQDKMVGALNLSRINEKRVFTEGELEFVCILADHASVALQNQHLQEEVRKTSNFRKNYEQHLDNLMNQLQNVSSEERRRIDEHIGSLLAGFKSEKDAPSRAPELGTALPREGVVSLTGEARYEDSPENFTEKIQVEIEAEGEDLTRAGVFIPTANPRDLGELFSLRLYLSASQPLELPCKVIFTNKYGKESENLRRGMGIKFVEFPPEAQKKIRDCMHGSAGQDLADVTSPPPSYEKIEIQAILNPPADAG